MTFSSQVTQDQIFKLFFDHVSLHGAFLCQFQQAAVWHIITKLTTLRLVHTAAVALDDTPFAHVQNVTRHAQAVLHHASLPSNHAHNFVETLPALFER